MILVVNDYDSLYSKFWSYLGDEITHDPEILFREPESIKLVAYTGGEDVSPSLYGHRDLGSHYSQARDAREVLIFQQAEKHQIPQTGICRGAQFLNVMCGGTTIQDLRARHGGGTHRCETFDGKQFLVTSSHHQMCVPGEGGEVLAWAHIRLNPDSCVYDGELPESVLEDGRVRVTEAIYYPEKKIFACQHHPEWQNIEEEAPQWTLQMIHKYCWDQERQQQALTETAE